MEPKRSSRISRSNVPITSWGSSCPAFVNFPLVAIFTRCSQCSMNKTVTVEENKRNEFGILCLCSTIVKCKVKKRRDPGPSVHVSTARRRLSAKHERRYPRRPSPTQSVLWGNQTYARPARTGNSCASNCSLLWAVLRTSLRTSPITSSVGPPGGTSAARRGSSFRVVSSTFLEGNEAL